MPDRYVHPPELAKTLERFPAEAQLIRRLFLADRAFRSACDDYRLACAGLAKLGASSATPPLGIVEEYRGLVLSLEAEIKAMLSRSGAAIDPKGTSQAGNGVPDGQS